MALFLHFFSNSKKDDIELGLFEFNATLIGISNVYMFDMGFNSICILVVCCIASVPLAKFINPILKHPPYTTPFVIITWTVVLIGNFLGLKAVKNILNFPTDLHSFGFAECVNQVYLQSNVISGSINLIAVLLCSKSSFIWVLITASF